jgi:hypothetical protein
VTTGLTIVARVKRLQSMPLADLQFEWERVFGEPPRHRNRARLWRRLALQLQLDQLTPQEQEAVQEYREKFDLLPPSKWFPGAKKKPRPRPERDHRLPPPGTTISRMFRGHTIVVTVLEKGFMHCDRPYRSLTAIAREVSGVNWSGFDFFGLKGENQA